MKKPGKKEDGPWDERIWKQEKMLIFSDLSSNIGQFMVGLTGSYGVFLFPIGSVCMVYILTWLGYIDGKWHTINTAYIRIRHGFFFEVCFDPEQWWFLIKVESFDEPCWWCVMMVGKNASECPLTDPFHPYGMLTFPNWGFLLMVYGKPTCCQHRFMCSIQLQWSSIYLGWI